MCSKQNSLTLIVYLTKTCERQIVAQLVRSKWLPDHTPLLYFDIILQGKGKKTKKKRKF